VIADVGEAYRVRVATARGAPCVVASIGPICFLRWSKRPTVDEVRTVVSAVLSVRRTVARPLTLLVIVPSDSDVPAPGAMWEMVRNAGIIDRSITVGITILEGDRVATRLLRGSLDAIAAVLRTPWEVTEDCDDGLSRACRSAGLDVERVRAAAIASELIRS
jgi:hypothetical protein